MKNRNGFTLIEIIGAVIILGIIAIFAVVTYTNSLKGFKENYYIETERTLQESGKEFFSNYRNYRPDMVLGSQKVLLQTLIGENYISDVKDYDGKLCDYTASYVLIVKEGKNSYSYHTCLICSTSGYDGTSSNYCDPSWADSSRIFYTLETPTDIYIYKGTSREELKNKLLLGLTVVRKNYAGEEIGRLDGTGADEVPQILPGNIDVVDVDTVGTYVVRYEYNGQTPVERRVIVYENDVPESTATYENTIVSGTMTQINGTGSTTTTETGTYPPTGRWAQKITLVLSSENGGGADIEKFQWNKGGRWTDVCTADSNNSCTFTYGDDTNEGDMYEEVQFRSVDKEGKISKTGNTYLFMIDQTKPKCELNKTGTILVSDTNPWYTSDVRIAFDTTGNKTTDQSAGIANAISGIKVNTIALSTATLDRTNYTALASTYKEQKSDTSGATYIGYVEDEAGNFGTCTTTLRRDEGKPECALTASGTKKDGTDTYLSNVTISFSKHTDSMSDVANYGIGSTTGNKTATLSTNTTQSYTGYIIDNAGNQDTCTLSVTRNTALTLTYNSNNGNACDPSTKTINYNSTYGTLCTPTRTGYTANGWWTQASGGTQVKATDTVSVTTDPTIYAHWTANTYTVTLDSAGGSGGSTSVTATYGSAMPTATAPTKSGYTFGGYYTATNGGGTQYYNASMGSVRNWDKTSENTLYANWIANTYTITANANGGSISSTTGWTGTGSTATKKFTYGSKYSFPAVSRTGYDFDGWWTQASGGTQITTSTTVTSNRTIYAHWKDQRKYTLTVKGSLDGEISNSFIDSETGQTYATIDVKIDGVTKATNVTSYSGEFTNGSSYTITVNRGMDWKINGTGVYSGTINGSNVTETISLSRGGILAINGEGPGNDSGISWDTATARMLTNNIMRVKVGQSFNVGWDCSSSLPNGFFGFSMSVTVYEGVVGHFHQELIDTSQYGYTNMNKHLVDSSLINFDGDHASISLKALEPGYQVMYAECGNYYTNVYRRFLLIVRP